MRFGIAQGIYVHRYGQVYESARDDLLAFVPPGATEILDVGCAKGLAGERLKQRQQCIVTGVEIDAALASRARQRLDQVIEGDIASLIGTNRLGLYDCVLCGDILEHLDDVWGVVEGLKVHLRTGGLLIASVPNVSNWAILYDLLIGRWDYVPFSILSGTHIRFFTKETAEELFRSAGYEVKNLNLQTLEIPPRGEAFLNELKRVFPEVNEDEMRASEILIVATPASSGKEVV